MKTLQQKLDETLQGAAYVAALLSKYPQLTEGDLHVFDAAPKIELSDAALAGATLGKTGWERSFSPYGSYGKEIVYDWTKTVDGVFIKVTRAEIHTPMDKTPVPPAMFPLQLENADDATEMEVD